jgi:4-alpha-glucanotransferase
MNQRASGILLHPTSLSNRYPIGDLGPAATAFADYMVKCGQRWWQMLPIGPAGRENSPYQSPSAFGGNPLLVSPDRLMEQGLLGRQDIELPISEVEGKVNYPAAARLKLRWLKKAFEHFEKNRHGGRQFELDAFVRAESFWLEDFSLFSAIKGKEGTSDWTRWNQELRTRQPDAIIRAQKYFANDIRYHQFVQWQFSVQWKELRAYCTSRGICLIGDVPLFVAHQSADVWAHPEFFKLDAQGNPTVVAGVPPDYFSKAGQLWGLPVYRWEALQEQNYSWWIERLRTACGRFDVTRLDHFIGFVRTYEVPAQAKSAVNGQYQPGGGTSFFEAALKALGALPFIADDLGATTPEVAALLDQLQIPGTRVLQFEFGSNLENNSVPPEQHPVNSVVYTGTHDNDTTAGWYRKLPSTQRKALQKRLGANDREIVWGMIREALASQANTTIVPAQDLLELGSEARMNFPGIAKGNWRWRLKDGALTQELAQRLLNITTTYGRLSGEALPAPRCQEDDPTPQIAKRAYEPYERRGPPEGTNCSRLAPSGTGKSQKDATTFLRALHELGT